MLFLNLSRRELPLRALQSFYPPLEFQILLITILLEDRTEVNVVKNPFLPLFSPLLSERGRSNKKREKKDEKNGCEKKGREEEV